jgi:hypothetical protein
VSSRLFDGCPLIEASLGFGEQSGHQLGASGVAEREGERDHRPLLAGVAFHLSGQVVEAVVVGEDRGIGAGRGEPPEPLGSLGALPYGVDGIVR